MMMARICRAVAVAVLTAVVAIGRLPGARAQAPGESAEEPERLRSWRYAAGGISVELTQRLPDQTRGFLEARGFAPGYANEIASFCFFQTVVTNTAGPGGGVVEFDLSEWRAVRGEVAHRLRLREEWESIWSGREVSDAARIAFKWSLLPTRQTYAPGEYNWGMTSFALPVGAHFDLEFSFRRGNQRSVHHFKGVKCAPDVRMRP